MHPIGSRIRILSASDDNSRCRFSCNTRVYFAHQTMQGFDGTYHLAFTELDLNGSPSAVSQLNNGICLGPCTVSVVSDFPVEPLSVDSKVADDQGLEKQAEGAWICKKPFHAPAKGGHRQ